MNTSTLERSSTGELGRFVRSWMRSPLSIGAVAPSGRALTRLMTRDVFAGARVVELGPGTGTLTRALLERGVDETDLYLLERSAGFAQSLAAQFPRATIVQGDATQPAPELAKLAGAVDFVISGLPLVLFNSVQRAALVERCFELLGSRGTLMQFTYGGRCPISARLLAAHRLIARRVGIAAINVPPAFVYRIARDSA